MEEERIWKDLVEMFGMDGFWNEVLDHAAKSSESL